LKAVRLSEAIILPLTLSISNTKQRKHIMSLENLVEMSNRYGSNEEFVLAGGGNTSYKEGGVLYVKGSGVQLSDIRSEQFVLMDINKLLEMVGCEYPADMDFTEKEEKTLSDMMAARKPGEENKRPSVESVLHAMFPFKLVLHVHPALINGLTCSVNGKTSCGDLFGDKTVWIDATQPGLALAQSCNEAFNVYTEKTGKSPQTVFLQNHGIFIAADTVDEIDKLMEYVVDTIRSKILEVPRFEVTATIYDMDSLHSMKSKLKSLYTVDGTAVVMFCTNSQVVKFVADSEAFKPVSKSFTPDHIVNCKDEPLFIESEASLEADFKAYETKKGFKPRIVAVRGLGFYAVSETHKNAERAQALFLDSIKIATYAKSFGGASLLSDELTDFILNWEVEAYRSKA